MVEYQGHWMVECEGHWMVEYQGHWMVEYQGHWMVEYQGHWMLQDNLNNVLKQHITYHVKFWWHNYTELYLRLPHTWMVYLCR